MEEEDVEMIEKKDMEQKGEVEKGKKVKGQLEKYKLVIKMLMEVEK